MVAAAGLHHDAEINYGPVVRGRGTHPGVQGEAHGYVSRTGEWGCGLLLLSVLLLLT